MKKTIFFIAVLFIAVSVFVSCTKTCVCAHVLFGEKITKDVEQEKYKKNCKDQSEEYELETYVDTLGQEQIIPDSVARFVCE